MDKAKEGYSGYVDKVSYESLNGNVTPQKCARACAKDCRLDCTGQCKKPGSEKPKPGSLESFCKCLDDSIRLGYGSWWCGGGGSFNLPNCCKHYPSLSICQKHVPTG